ncbi:hypothetical protein [Sinomonas sp. P47F7]|uniref:hypothetical protein n=1 Tax=Sinomonas sp. P47F7 TaxID=3410987 RepID=UPI003BF4BD1C
MRTFVSALSVLLAVVLAAVAAPALWLQQNVADEAGFVRLLDPMARDADLQSALVSNLDTAVLANSGIPAVARPVAQKAIEGLAQGLVSDPGFPQAWTDTLRASHQLNFTPGTASANAFELQLRPVAALLVSKLGGAIGVTLPVPSSLVVQVGTAQQRSWVTGAQDLSGLAQPLSLGAVLALALGLLAARHRGVALAWAGLGLLVVAAADELTTGLVPAVGSALGSSGSMSSTFGARAAELAAASFQPWIGGVAVAGAAFLVVGAVVGAAGRIRRRRTDSRDLVASMES